jgi:hypothetical protein
VKALLHPFLSIASFHRPCRLTWTTHLDVCFQELPHQFAGAFL